MGAPAGGRGPLGEPRSIAKTILLAIVTLGIWAALWTYWNYRELERYRGDGIGGALGVVIHIFVTPVTYFLMASEVEKLYSEEGQEPPVRTITGLWLLLPLAGPFVWYVKVQNAINDFWMARGAPAPS
ncbi:hypothetical protein BH20ACT2_BH20ACT2_10120 [soil metagenome]